MRSGVLFAFVCALGTAAALAACGSDNETGFNGKKDAGSDAKGDAKGGTGGTGGTTGGTGGIGAFGGTGATGGVAGSGGVAGGGGAAGSGGVAGGGGVAGAAGAGGTAGAAGTGGSGGSDSGTDASDAGTDASDGSADAADAGSDASDAGGDASDAGSDASDAGADASDASDAGGCSQPSDCPGTDTACKARTCVNNVCGLSFTASGTATSSQTAGDCQQNQCDGAGNIVSVALNSDVPADDGNQCTGEVCTAGVPSHPLQPVDFVCSQNGGSVCSAAGTCVECNSALQCGVSTDCKTFSCSSNTCSSSNVAAGTPTGTQTAGDCQKNQCDGSGASQSVADDTDVPADDGNQCTNEICTSGVPSHPNKPVGTACSQSGGTLCDGLGACIAASCNDTIQDGSETDVDCGGGACPPCASGKMCAGNADCQSGKCTGGTCADVLVLSEVQTRGSTGGNDEFIEIYNPTNATVTFDSTWTVATRSAVGTCTSNNYGVRITGAGQAIGPHKHILFTNSSNPGYDGAVSGDATYTTGFVDAASIVLYHGTTAVDALCYYFDATTQTNLTSCATPYVCEGTPIVNPHNNTSSTNTDASLERKPGGAAGNGTDTNDNVSDFMSNTTPNPQNLASAATP